MAQGKGDYNVAGYNGLSDKASIELTERRWRGLSRHRNAGY